MITDAPGKGAAPSLPALSRVLAVLGAVAAIGPFTVDMYLPALPAISGALATDTAGAQLTLTAFFVGFGVGQLACGPLTDWLGRRPVLLGGLAFFILTTTLCALADSIWHLIAARLLQGLAAGAGPVVARAVIRDLLAGNAAARAQSLVILLMSVAPLIAPITGGWVTAWLGWRAVFWALVAYAAVCLAAVTLGLPETHPRERRQATRLAELLRGYARVLRHRQSLGYLLCGGMAFGGLFAYISGTPFVYIEIFDVRPEHYGYLFGLNVLGILAGTYLNSRWVMRSGYRRLLSAGTLTAAVASTGLLATAATGMGGLVGIVAPLFFVVSTIGVVGANSITGALAARAELRGTASALFGAFQFGCGALAGTAVGQLHDGTPVPMAGVIAATSLAAWGAQRWLTAGGHDAPAPPRAPHLDAP